LDGVITLKPEDGSDRNVVGEFKGTLTKPGGVTEEVHYALGGRVRLGKPVSADPNRTLEVEVADANVQTRRVRSADYTARSRGGGWTGSRLRPTKITTSRCSESWESSTSWR